MYEIIRLLHVANIDELTKNNFKITRAHCHRNIVAYEKLIRNYRKKLNDILKKQSKHQIENSDFINTVKNTYDSKNLRRELYKENIEDNSVRVNNYDSEIFEKTNLDNQDVMAKTIQLEFVGSQPDATLLEEYEEELKNCFFSYNQGLDSRFTWRFSTDDYSYKELFLIFKKKVNDIGWKLSKKVKDEWFEEKMDYFKFFGRDIETLLAKIKIAHGRRVFCLHEDKKKIIS